MKVGRARRKTQRITSQRNKKFSKAGELEKQLQTQMKKEPTKKNLGVKFRKKN